ncbi:hypothetical protein ACSBR1_031456 [Camellia fascicularis]
MLKTHSWKLRNNANRSNGASADSSLRTQLQLRSEKEFKVEVEAIGKVKHKHLVGLLGYCAEGAKRLLVYEYIDNGNLEQWLHGDVGPISPLTWDIRIQIAVGTAKGLAYLHEGLEPKIVHCDVKSSNILPDRKWNPKVSNFGLAKLLGAEKSYVTTRVIGTFGYVSPEYASTGMLNEGSDVYSFGVLLMEIITGRNPVDYSRPPGETNLVDWFKGMVASRSGEEVVDPLIRLQPSPRALKRALLVCLRCIDLDANKRPKMGQIVHMLEADEFPFRAEPRTTKETAPFYSHLAVTNKVPHPTKDVEGDDVQRTYLRENCASESGVRAELRDELREELRAEFSTHLQQMRTEMMAFVSQGASVPDASSGHRAFRESAEDENPYIPPPEDQIFPE